jgi:hypothetical protein
LSDDYYKAVDIKASDPSSISKEKINQLLKEAQAVYEYEYKPIYKLYRELPEEYDAFETSNLLEKAYSQRPLRSKSLPDKQDESSSLVQPEQLSLNPQKEQFSKNTIANESTSSLEQIKNIYEKMYMIARGETTGNYLQDDIRAAKNLEGRQEAYNIMYHSSNAKDLPESKKTDYLELVYEKVSEPSHKSTKDNSRQR